MMKLKMWKIERGRRQFEREKRGSRRARIEEDDEEEEEDILVKSRPQGADLIRKREEKMYVLN